MYIESMIPLFKTHFSIGKSILRLEDIDRITTDQEIEEVYLVEDSMTGFPEAFRLFGDRLRFGLRFSIFNENEEGESKMIAFANGDAGCKDLYKLYTKMFDTKLVTPWNDYENLVFVVPFYDSFLHKNLTSFSNCMPDLPDNITFFIEKNGLPFDSILEQKVISYKSNKQDVQFVKSIYYENKEDVEAFQTYKCICNRQPGRQASLSNPRLDHFGSDRFCIEAWKEDK